MKPLSLKELSLALDLRSDTVHVLFDPTTGKVHTIDDTYGPEEEHAILDEPGMVFVPEIDTSEEVLWMRTFAASQEDPKVRGALLTTFEGPRLFRRFKDMAHGLGVLRAWQDERDRRRVEWLREWLAAERIPYVDDVRQPAAPSGPAARQAQVTPPAQPQRATPAAAPSPGDAPSPAPPPADAADSAETPADLPPGRPHLRVLKGGRRRPRT